MLLLGDCYDLGLQVRGEGVDMATGVHMKCIFNGVLGVDNSIPIRVGKMHACHDNITHLATRASMCRDIRETDTCIIKEEGQ